MGPFVREGKASGPLRQGGETRSVVGAGRLGFTPLAPLLKGGKEVFERNGNACGNASFRRCVVRSIWTRRFERGIDFRKIYERSSTGRAPVSKTGGWGFDSLRSCCREAAWRGRRGRGARDSVMPGPEMPGEVSGSAEQRVCLVHSRTND